MHKLLKPINQQFSSGPCKKNPDWSINNMAIDTTGRSHRSDLCIQKIQQVIQLTRDILKIPPDYLLTIIPGSATGAMGAALWNLLGYTKTTTIMTQDVFSERWLYDVSEQLKLPNLDIRKVKHGAIPQYKNIPQENDLVFCWNGSTAGVQFHQDDFLENNRSGLVICDVTSCVFAVDLPWKKFDAIAFSWQKGLGSEGAHGMLALSPQAVNRIKNYQPLWGVPFLLNLRKNADINTALFAGYTNNTPSMLCIEDFLLSLFWAQKIGGLAALIKRTENNFQVVNNWVNKTPWIDFVAENKQTISKTTVCLKIIDSQIQSFTTTQQWQFLQKITQYLASEKVAFDILNHPASEIPSLRIWCGPTVENIDIQKLLPWIAKAFRQVKSYFITE